MLCPVKAALMS